MKNFVEEFKIFALKGNVVDLAVAVVIGAAFGKIVSSLVENIITPLIGILVGGVDLKMLSLDVGGALLTYGIFLQNIFDFLIITLAIFVAIKVLAKLKEDKIAEEVKPTTPPEEIVLLREIRNSLRK